MKNCIKCGEAIPEGRLKALPTAKTCINCSGVQKKGTITVMKGEGDHTWIETIHLEHDEYKAYIEAENKLRRVGSKLLELIDEPQQDVPYGFKEVKSKDEE
jgi:hypothetical protein